MEEILPLSVITDTRIATFWIFLCIYTQVEV